MPRRTRPWLSCLLLAALAHLLWRQLRKPPPPAFRPAQNHLWGSLLHASLNHPDPTPPPPTLPWRGTGMERRHQIVRVWIVTAELAGLQRNGGIGSAYLELARRLAREESMQVNILMAREGSEFPTELRDGLVEELQQRNITLHFLVPTGPPIFPAGWTPVASVQLLRHLRPLDASIDVLHLPENSGIGYFTILAQHTGLAFQRTHIVVGLHGPEVEWARMLNREGGGSYEVELSLFERRSAELAGTVVAPSAYMLEYVQQRGWSLPPRRLVIPNIVAAPAMRRLEELESSTPLNEIVFFGRLEERKGIRLFISALELLLVDNSTVFYDVPPIDVVTFLGRDQTDPQTGLAASTLLKSALDKLQRRAARPFTFHFLLDYDRERALEYLSHPSRLTVMPALADNSPSTVLECIGQRIRFITSDVGGIPELVDVGDWGRVLFPPTTVALATKIWSLFKAPQAVQEPVRAAAAATSAGDDWVDLHFWLQALPFPKSPAPYSPRVTLCITHYERPDLLPQLLESIRRQSYDNFELVLVDDGSTSAAALTLLDELDASFPLERSWRVLRIDNSYLGEARNRAAALASGEFLLFLDDDDVLKPHALSTLVSVAQRTNVSALSSWLDEFASESSPLSFPVDTAVPHRRTFYFPGPSLALGIERNCFGSGNVFVRKSAFDSVGGYSELRDVGGEDWELYMKLVLGGYSLEVIPEELIWVRSDPRGTSMKWSMNTWDASYRALTPLLDDRRIGALGLGPAFLLSKSSLSASIEPPSATFADSKLGFELVQGWNGWRYFFVPTDEGVDAVNPIVGISTGTQWSTSKGSFLPPFLASDSQSPSITPRGQSLSAVRAFRSPRAMDVALQLDYKASHQCGDGTELRLLLRARDKGELRELARRRTMQVGRDSIQLDLTLAAGATIYIISDPLATDECDGVDLRLTLRPVQLDSLAWSALAKQEMAAEAAMKIAEDSALSLEETEEVWSIFKPTSFEAVLPPFHLCLIFDRHRLAHAKQVIRSAAHFIQHRALVFHLISPLELHGQIRDSLATYDIQIDLYDHSLCRHYARAVLPFSEPDIHVSAHCKMFLAQILPTPRVLYLDTDTTIVSDITACYETPRRPQTLMTMAIDMGDGCQRSPDLCWPIGLHWRVPADLECGNTPGREGPAGKGQCARTGEMETVQVNGGVILMELDRMREDGFQEKYIQSVVHHFRSTESVARWGEQDFINSYFRLYPLELEWLPCGCNYQWFGNRREVKCGEQPVRIAHAWSHGIAVRSQNPYNRIFHHFLDDGPTSSLPPLPPLSLSAPGSPNTSLHRIEHNLNCPTQSHDCSMPFQTREYGQDVVILSRIVVGTFAQDLVDSVAEQTYPHLLHVLAKPAGLDLEHTEVMRIDLDVESDLEGDYAGLCERCGALAEPGFPCDTPPTDLAARKDYLDCYCSSPDSTSNTTRALEGLVSRTSWILYLNDDRLFASSDSLALLMAQVDSPDQVVVFRANSSTRDQEFEAGRKTGRSALLGSGFVFHSTHLDLSHPGDDRCGSARTLENLSTRLALKWVDAVPLIAHPLARHRPALSPAAFRITVLLFESVEQPSWLPIMLDELRGEGMRYLIDTVVVLSSDREPGTLDDVRIVNLTTGSGLEELGGLAKTDGVLLLSDSIRLDKASLTALINVWLENPARIIGPFAPIAHDSFPLPLENDIDLFDYDDEADPFLSPPETFQILSRVLLTHSSHLTALSTALAIAPLHPLCHNTLLNGLATLASGSAPLKVLLPPRSIVDRVRDCRIRSWTDVSYGPQPGDADEDEPEPSPADCARSVEERLGTSLVGTGDVAAMGVAGMKEGVEQRVSAARWRSSQRMEQCFRTPIL